MIFLYNLTKEKGLFQIFQHSLGRVTADRRLQILLIPFCFGAFFEGAAGFGTPVAVCSAMLMGLGFSPLTSAAMALFANTATVAFGAIGAPINGLAQSTGIDPLLLGKAIGIQSVPFSIIIPFYMLWVFCGWKKTMEVLPAILVAALSFTIPQFLISYYRQPLYRGRGLGRHFAGVSGAVPQGLEAGHDHHRHGHALPRQFPWRSKAAGTAGRASHRQSRCSMPGCPG